MLGGEEGGELVIRGGLGWGGDCREVDGEDFNFDGGVRGGDLVAEGEQFGFGAGGEDEVVASRGELEGELFADAVAGAGDDSPGAGGAEGRELCGGSRMLDGVETEGM